MSADTTFSTARGAQDGIGEGSLTGMDRQGVSADGFNVTAGVSFRQGVSADTTFSTARGARNATLGEGSFTGSMRRASVSGTVVSCQSFSF